ncbi:MULTISPECIES: MFS transporter [Variovorax]|uniref:MFS transporter n=1 Tax=Variovorax TaxID=34072 RepID=UPI00086DC4F3|nr:MULTISPECIES: MFS transporter [Variovorax]MBN8752163.1 MFS transporter [Variovorax sp.]ODU18341.1 MAG: transporter [Variovorax sp. SCN 67-85]ODV26937.1 MAG: transporter [Variovorax sp. SCN 67-20]OJZ09031.1 MAG: MFS transporter [Variovorax sp. 67-131]UKI11499.1 MFS transporter [Variovorax paradoxus]
MSRPAPKGALWALLAGNFVIGTGVMVVPGTLNEISASLAVSVATAGQLITAAAAVMCIGAPLLAAAVAGWDRRQLLALTLLWYAVGHALAALMPSFGALLPVRMLTVIAPAIFTPQAAACAGMLVPPEQRGRAVTFVFLGWSMASVLGLPIGALIGGHLGWRMAFGAIALLSVVSAASIWFTLPNGIRPAALTAAAWSRVLRSPVLMGIVSVTALQGTGQFVLFSYFGPILKQSFGADATTLSVMWALFGACGLIGNMVVSRFIDRVGAGRMVLITTVLIALSLLLWPTASTLAWLAVVLVPWGLGCFATNSAQQARLVGLAPALAPGSVALNSSGIYTGQAVGAALGGWLLAHDAAAWMSWVGFGVMLVAIALSTAIDRSRRPA